MLIILRESSRLRFLNIHWSDIAGTGRGTTHFFVNSYNQYSIWGKTRGGGGQQCIFYLSSYLDNVFGVNTNLGG